MNLVFFQQLVSLICHCQLQLSGNTTLRRVFTVLKVYILEISFTHQIYLSDCAAYCSVESDTVNFSRILLFLFIYYVYE